jgi:hypothetical protein
VKIHEQTNALAKGHWCYWTKSELQCATKLGPVGNQEKMKTELSTLPASWAAHWKDSTFFT